MILEEVKEILNRTLHTYNNRSLCGTLKEIKLSLKEWKRNTVANQEDHIKRLENELKKLDMEEDNNELKSQIFEQLQNAYQSKLSQLQQKSRIKWDLEGDSNTSFFHKVIHQRRRRNQIQKLVSNNALVLKPMEIKNALLQDFSDFYCNSINHTPFSLSKLEWKSVSREESSFLTRNFTEEEIFCALQESDSNKAPGPDGINAGWLKKLWPQISEKVLSFFEDFHHRGFIPQGANSSFIVLIPKKDTPMSMLDFRPISLINTLIKLLLKVLANRLKGVLSKIISEEQTAFVKGRNINESIFLVNEVIHSMKTHKVDGLIVKLDFAKAYDSIDWSCLLHVMECVNLDQKWISWIKAILESTRMSILVNGSPTEEFTPRRGIRQGILWLLTCSS